MELRPLVKLNAGCLVRTPHLGVALKNHETSSIGTLRILPFDPDDTEGS